MASRRPELACEVSTTHESFEPSGVREVLSARLEARFHGRRDARRYTKNIRVKSNL